jgi:integral membrane protein
MKSAVNRFRIMAIICGVMSLLLWFIYMPGKYMLDGIDDHKYLIAIPIVHGYLYMVYLLTALQVGVKGRWHLVKILWVMLAGTLPVASFIAERRIVKQYP